MGLILRALLLAIAEPILILLSLRGFVSRSVFEQPLCLIQSTGLCGSVVFTCIKMPSDEIASWLNLQQIVLDALLVSLRLLQFLLFLCQFLFLGRQRCLQLNDGFLTVLFFCLQLRHVIFIIMLRTFFVCVKLSFLLDGLIKNELKHLNCISTLGTLTLIVEICFWRSWILLEKTRTFTLCNLLLQ